MKKIYFVLFAILCTIVFSCTDNLISTDLDSHKNSVTSELRVFVKESRLIGPELSDVSWEVFLCKDNDLFSGKSINGYYLFSGLESGTYSIFVSGKIDNVEKFAGSAIVTLDDGQNLDVNVPVVASKNSSDTTSTGFATITMEMSEELLGLISDNYEEPYLYANLSQRIDDADIFFEVTLVQPNVETGTITIINNQKVDFVDSSDNPSIPVGYYYLTFSEFYPYSIKLKDNLVEIGDGLTTNIVLTQNDYEIVENYSSILYVNNEGGETADGKTLSNPIAFSSLNDDNFSYADVLYLLSDVEFANGETTSLSPMFEDFSGTISSFNSTVRTISANISDYSSSITLGYVTLKNIKLSGSNKFSFSNLFVDETVILDCEMDNNSTVQLSKTSNLVVGKNFSGDLYISLSQENWQVGDSVISFENGNPEKCNFYIEEYCCNSQEQYYSAMFYIDDSGKLARVTDDFTAFAWSGTVPHLVTKTQAKNNTYTSIFYKGSNDLKFTGISTYDGNNTWYFIGREESGSLIPYSVTLTDKYTNSVEAEPVFIDTVQFDIQAMSYDAGKLYFGSKSSDEDGIQLNLSFMEGDNRKSCSVLITSQDYYIGDLTSLLVKGNEVYFATTITSNGQNNNPTTHSAIWKCELTTDDSGEVQLITKEENDYPVPYYLTHSDIELTVKNGSFPEGSTFRITDLYSDGTSVYGLLANYIETNQNNSGSYVYMRGSVFKLQENSTSANATHYGLRKDSLQISDIPTAKQYFILPRKIVGIINKKLIIADDGMIPDKTDCNLDRFILFDLDGSISEKIDVDVSFTTSGSTSGFATNTLF